jgi:hypothetical protein
MISLPKPRPYNHIRKPSAADWGLGVTTCIAAAAKRGKELILVTDQKVAFGDFSADDAVLKNVPFIFPWAVLFSGDDISYAHAVIERAFEEAMQATRSHGKPLTGADIAEILYEELVKERQRLIEASVLRKYGFTTDTFRDTGKNLCTESFYGELIYKISQIEISIKLLLCGFNKEHDAEIWSIEPDSPPQNYDTLGFWAIGSGANSAVSSLAHSVEHQGVNRFKEIEDVLYSVLAAKFMSESAKDVGKGTFVVVLQPNRESGASRFLSRAALDKIRVLWEKEGAPRVPPSAPSLIKSELYSVTLRGKKNTKQSNVEKSKREP